ncbi:hypothetical protein BDQ17DRAFT_1326554 [Cyathus striatus]|nr:hypothetical protein BDQ17DRAFT_1326554 [Cyathus striatus]
MPVSDSEGSVIDLSSAETHFEPQDGDKDTLWEVIEITAEKERMFKVKWAGIDPQTNKPWGQSWVPKRDVTDDLVLAWKRKKKNTKPKKGKASRFYSIQEVHRVSWVIGVGGLKTIRIYRYGYSSSSLESKEETYFRSSARPKKRTLQDTISNGHHMSMDTTSTAPPRKKRKVMAQNSDEEGEQTQTEDDEESYPVQKNNSKAIRQEEDEEEQEEDQWPPEVEVETVDLNIPPTKPRASKQLSAANLQKGKGRSRSKSKATSRASTSSHVHRYSDHPPPPTTLSKSLGRKRVPESDSEDFDLPPPPPKVAKRSSNGASSEAASKGRSSVKDAGTKSNTKSIPSRSSSLWTAEPLRMTNDSRRSSANHKHAVSPSREVGSGSEKNSDEDKDEDDDNDGAPTVRYSPALSQWALNRLVLFDAEIEQIVRDESPVIDMDTDEDDERPAHEPQKDKVPLFLLGSREPSIVPVLSLPTNGTRSPPRTVSLRDGDYVIDRSYELEVIPETESSLFNSQSQEKERAVPVSPSRSPVKSRMKPRLIGSSSESNLLIMDDYQYGSVASDKLTHGDGSPGPAEKTKSKKPLKPIPVISPSKFTPHLPSSPAVEPNSTIETPPELPSSIETIESFDSPDKNHRLREMESRLEDAEEAHERVLRRGAELAEIALERQTNERGPENVRVSLHEVSKKRKVRSTGILKIFPNPVLEDGAMERDEGKQVSDHEEEDDKHDDQHRSSSPKIDANVVQELEDAFVDLNGGMDIDVNNHDESMYTQEVPMQDKGESEVDDTTQDEDCEEADTGIENESMYMREVLLERGLLREEEEENTQDIMQDLNMQRRKEEMDAENANLTLPESQVPQATPTSGYMGDNSRRADDVSKQDVTQSSLPLQHALPASSPPPPESAPNTQSLQRVRSLSPAGSQASQTLQSQTLSTIASFKVTEQPTAIAEYNAKLAIEEHKNKLLAMERDALKKALDQMHLARSTAEEEMEMQLDASRNLLNSERAKHEAELITLNNVIEEANRDRMYAENDCKSIRDAYNRADSFAMSLRKENAELEERSAVAENQAKVGVAAIRKTFEMRVKQLEDDARMWKKTANFLMEKDMRTNDEIRRRAAEHPQLELQVKELEERLESAVNNIHGLAKQISEREVKITHVEAERDKWKQEAEMFYEQLEDLKSKVRKFEWSRDEPMVYACECESEDHKPCGALLFSKEEHVQHMRDAGHFSVDTSGPHLKQQGIYARGDGVLEPLH